MDTNGTYQLLVLQQRLINRILAAIEERDWAKVVNTAHDLLDLETELNAYETKSSR
jgi:hypothetical protein